MAAIGATGTPIKLSRYEQETVISWNREEDKADIYTFEPTLKKQLEELAGQRPGECKLIKAESVGSVRYEVSKKILRVAFRKQRPMTDAQKAARNANFSKMKQTAGEPQS